MISQLEESGYVTRTRLAEDNRVVMVELTPAGREVAEKVPMGGIPLLRRRLNNLPEDRLRRIEASLDDIMQLMEVTDDE
jgi:DNA-binding MarR family transcriptional regulator